MPHRGGRPRPNDYAPLLAYLAAQQETVVTLSLPQITRMIGVPLPDTAYVRHAFWAGSSVALVGKLIAAGWRAQLRVRAQVVIFTRFTTQEREAKGHVERSTSP